MAEVANKWEMPALPNEEKVATPYTSENAGKGLKNLAEGFMWAGFRATVFSVSRGYDR